MENNHSSWKENKYIDIGISIEKSLFSELDQKLKSSNLTIDDWFSKCAGTFLNKTRVYCLVNTKTEQKITFKNFIELSNFIKSKEGIHLLGALEEYQTDYVLITEYI